MNPHNIFTIAQKDITEAAQNRSVWLPMLLVPLIFVIVMPLAIILIPANYAPQSSGLEDPDLQMFMQRMPASITTMMQGMDDFQKMIFMMLGFLLAPMFLIMPLMFSTTIAAESFAGERERKTMESLLYSPATDGELFTGKVLAAFVPALMITWVSFLVYIVVINTTSYPLFQRIWFPVPSWFPLIFWVSPALALLGIATTVIISTRVQTFMGAYQASASLVLLVVGLMAGQASGVIYLNVEVGLILGSAIFLIDAILVAAGIRLFQRNKLLTSI